MRNKMAQFRHKLALELRVIFSLCWNVCICQNVLQLYVKSSILEDFSK